MARAMMARGLAMLVAAAILCGSAPSQAALVTRSGTVKVTVTVSVGASIPASAKISANVRVDLYDFKLKQYRTVTASGVLHRSGKSATGNFALPYKWALDTLADTIVVIGMSISSSAGVSVNASTSTTIALPANGATTTVQLPGSI